MDLEGRLTFNGRAGAVAISATVIRPAHLQEGGIITLPAATAGTLSIRTDDDEGTLTMEAGHGITTGATFDLYWVGGRRYGVTAGTVATNSVPFSGGAGDNLPAEDFAVTASLQKSIPVSVNCDLLRLIFASCVAGIHLAFLVSSSVELDVNVEAGGVWAWWKDNGFTNPLAGHSITSVKASQAGVAVNYLNLGLLYNCT